MSAKHTAYPHMCRDGHAEIGHSDSEHEMCPLCRAMADRDELLKALKALCDYIDREGPAAKEWQAISEWCEKGHAAIARAEGGQS